MRPCRNSRETSGPSAALSTPIPLGRSPRRCIAKSVSAVPSPPHVRSVRLLAVLAACRRAKPENERTSYMVNSTPQETAAPTVVELVRAAQAGDRDAFGDLYLRYQRTVYSVCRRRARSEAEAQELCQDVFVQALRKLPNLRQPEAFGGWLRAIANRLAINRLVRRTPIATASAEVLDAEGRADSNPLESMLREERREELRHGLTRLRPLDRDTLVAFYVQGRSLVEMSESFQAPLGTIKRRLHVARLRLAAEVEPAAVA